MNLSIKPVQLVLSLLYISSFDDLFMFGCICSRHDFQRMFLFEFIDTCVLVPARHLALASPLIGEFLTPLDLQVRS